MTPTDDQWPESILAELRAQPDAGVSVVIDPSHLLEPPDDIGQVVETHSWRELRATYELHGRRRPTSAGRLIIHVLDSAVRSANDLPWDIGLRVRVTEVRFAGGKRWIGFWRSLDLERQSSLANLLAKTRDPSPSSVLQAIYGVVLPAPDPAAELEAVMRLRLASFPTEAWTFVQPLLRSRAASGLAADPPDTTAVQEAWDDWLARGSDSSHASVLEASAGALVGLVTSGLLRPASRSASDLPSWTAIAAAEPDRLAALAALLSQRPGDVPASFDDWCATAMWWGAVRAAAADAGPGSVPIMTDAWKRWVELDAAWVSWLRVNLGLLQTSARPTPSTVDRIAPFLARRKRGGSNRICLLVMDGMGFTQWQMIRDGLGLTVHEAHGVAAAVPTLTPFSRQAIFAGTVPRNFAETMLNNSHEEERWRAFWVGEGVTSVDYMSTSGASGSAKPSLAAADVVGAAILAVDDLMHGAKLVGDAEVAGALRVWLEHGYLADVIRTASTAGFEVWLTSDHGNLEARAIDYLPMEGLAVDRTGERVRLYSTETLLDAARARGIAWQAPGLPVAGPFPLFAPGRDAYVRGSGPVVVHGGLSFDEVIVPLVRVSL